MKKWIVTLILCFQLYNGFAQISWVNKPRDFQFVSRNVGTNKGRVIFEGWVNQTGYNSIKISHKGALGAVVNYTIPINYNGSGQAYFYQAVNISAGKINHQFDVSLSIGAVFTTNTSIKNIACGDAYLISGQSNSVANSYYGLSNTNYRDSFIRSFGTSSPNALSASNDSNWYRADGDGIYNVGCIGQWGLVFARHVLDSTGIPICIINAGVGGTRITFHQKNINNGEDLNTNYGRMLYRAKKAGLHDKIRGIFWFQGESDGSNAQLHDSLFRKMQAEWFKDYPGLERVAVVQVRSGCGGPSLELREKQRLMKNIGRTVVISANGLNNHDGCHYWFKDGYEKLGVLLFHQIKSTLYGLKSTPDNQPLNPYLVYFSNSAKTELCVEITPLNANLKVDAGFYKLFSVAGSSVTITGGYLKNNKIYLTLNGSGCNVKSISYDGLPGNQPWVRTRADATLISFYNYPVIAVKPLPNMSICKGEKVILGQDSVPGNTYAWEGVLSGLTSQRANPTFMVPRSEKFRCIMKSSASGCLYDTFSQNVVVDTISSSNLPGTVFFCPTDSVEIGAKKSDWKQGLWKHGGLDYSGFFIKASDTGLWYFTATSSAGCKTFDTTRLSHFPPASKHLPTSIEICKGDFHRITAPPKSTFPIWNNTIAQDTCILKSNERKVLLQYNDSNGCKQHDSASIIELMPGSVQLDSLYSFCVGDTLFIDKPVAFTEWGWNGIKISDKTYLITQKGRYDIQLTDSRACSQKHIITAVFHPIFKLSAIDSGICLGDSIRLLKSGWMRFWSIDNTPSPQVVYLKRDGNFNISWQDSNHCRGNSAIRIETAASPQFSLPLDTLLCTGDSLVFQSTLSKSSFEFLAGNQVMYPLIIKKSGIYRFTAYDKPFCEGKHEMQVSEKICVSKINTIIQAPIKVIHMSGGIQLQSQSSESTRFKIFNAGFQLVAEGKIDSRQLQELRLVPGFYYVGIMNSSMQKPVFIKVPVY